MSDSQMVAPAAHGSSLTRKLAEIMGAVDRVPKRGRNAFHGYQYATEADIADVVRQELATRHVVIYGSVDAVETRVDTGDNGKPSNFVSVVMTFTIRDGETGDTMALRWAGAGQDRGEKGLYKAITGAEKYFLLKLFLIPTGDDPEDDSRDHKPNGHAPEPPRPPLPTPAPAKNGATISDAQRRRLYALAKKANWPDEELRAKLLTMGYAHSDQIRTADYDDICAFFSDAYVPPVVGGAR